MEAVELRPLSLGELLDRTFRLYRNHFMLFVGIMIVPALFWIPFNTLALSFEGSILTAAGTQPGKPPVLPGSMAITAGIVAAVLFYLLLLIVYSIALAAAAAAIADVYLGRTATVRGSYRRLSGRFWRVIGVGLNIFLRVFGLWIIVVGGCIGAFAGIGFLFSGGQGNPILAGFLAILVFVLLIAGGVLCVYLALRYALSIPVAMLENLGVLATIRRSVFLTKSRRGHIFVSMLVASIITYVGVFVLQMPFSIAMFVSASEGHWSQMLAFAAAVAGSVGSALTGPVSMIVIVLLYYDSRIRKEAFDLQFMMSSLDAAAPPSVGTVSPA